MFIAFTAVAPAFFTLRRVAIGTPQETAVPHNNTKAANIFRFFIRASFKIPTLSSRKPFAIQQPGSFRYGQELRQGAGHSGEAGRGFPALPREDAAGDAF